LADYGFNWAIIFGQITSFFSVYFAMPLLILPAKETVEEMFLKGTRKLSKKENFVSTLVLILISYIFAIFVPSIGDAMALAGCTTNPMIGFIIPVIMYWGIHKEKPILSKEKLLSGLVAVVIIITSILGLVNFVI
jgi:amino acid permease